MVFVEKNEFEIVMREKNEFEILIREMTGTLFTTWKRIAEFINDDLLGELYYMKRRFGYYFYDKDIKIVNNRPAIYVIDEESETHDEYFFSDCNYSEELLKELGYKLLYLEDIDKGDPYFTKTEKLKINFIKKTPNIFKKIYLLKPEIFNSDYYGLFSDFANSTFLINMILIKNLKNI